MVEPPVLIRPDWAAPARVRACMTTRIGGISAPPFASLNMGWGSGDSPALVLRNRAKVCQGVAAPADALYLRQVHGADLIWRQRPAAQLWPADAQWTDQPGLVLGVQVADCLPVLLCDEQGRFVMAVHAGWRGVFAGIVRQAVLALRARIAAGMRIFLWIGPGIGPCHFQVGAALKEQFCRRDPGYAAGFVGRAGQWYADLPMLVRAQLHGLGGVELSVDGRCTFCHADAFYSYRREGRCGRMAALIWLDP